MAWLGFVVFVFVCVRVWSKVRVWFVIHCMVSYGFLFWVCCACVRLFVVVNACVLFVICLCDVA